MTKLNFSVLFASILLLGGCQTLTSPQNSQPSQKPKQAETKTTPSQKDADGIKITPYDRPEIKREQLQIVIPEQKSSTQKFDDGRQLPAFKNLMQQTHHAFRQAKWSEAEKAALQAQRLAPQSAETYMYLAMIANQKNEAKNAESLAKRGLSYAQTATMKRQLWQIILKSGQLQKNQKLIQEAQNQIKKF